MHTVKFRTEKHKLYATYALVLVLMVVLLYSADFAGNAVAGKATVAANSSKTSVSNAAAASKTSVAETVSNTISQNMLELQRTPGLDEQQYLDNENMTKPKILGYIVEFYEKPAVAKRSEILKAISDKELELKNPKRSRTSIQNEINSLKSQLSSNVKLQRSKVIREQSKLLKVMQAKVPALKSPEKITNRFYNVFNGMALNITSQEAGELKKIPGVKGVYPNYEVRAMLMESVPLIGADQVWQLDADGNDCSASGNPCLTGQGVKIAIIDTGVDYTHPDLGGCFGPGCKVAGGYDIVNNDADPMDDHGHGTHVAGIAAGNGVLKGVAPDAKIYAYKVLDSGGYGPSDGVISGIERAVDPNNDGDFSDHVDVISMSLGAYCGSYSQYCGPDDAVSRTADIAVDAGVVVVVAAGNDYHYSTIGSPGVARKVITVGASSKNITDKMNNSHINIADFSSRGPVSIYRNGFLDEIIIKPDIVAPGSYICAAGYNTNERARCFGDDKHIAHSGTSMATPHVAGSAALLKQAFPTWKPEEIKMALRNTATDLINYETDKSYSILSQGYGLINVSSAVRSKKPPIAKLNFSSSTIHGVVDIKGTAISDGFSYYILEYSKIFSSDWILLKKGFEAVGDGVLYSSFDSSLISDGTYELRLTVFDKSGSNSIDKTFFTIGEKPKCYCSNCEECSACSLFPIHVILSQDIVSISKADFFTNVDSSSAECIEINSNNLTLDCNGHRMGVVVASTSECPYFFHRYIYARGGGQYISVENCLIDNFSSAVDLFGYDNIYLSNNSFFASPVCSQTGIVLAGALKGVLRNNSMIINPSLYRYSPWSRGISIGKRFLFESDVTKYYQGISLDNTNTINGKPIFYFFNISNKTIENINAGAVYLYFSYNNTINNISLETSDGLYITNSNDTIITNSIFSKNKNSIAIYAGNNNSINNKIIGNKINDSMYGIYFRPGHISIKNNIISGCDLGILFGPFGWKSDTSFHDNDYIEITDNQIFNSTVMDMMFVHHPEQNLSNLTFFHNSLNSVGTAFTRDIIPIELSYNRQGNYWGHSRPPYFCGFENQHPNCIDTWYNKFIDRDTEYIVDSCPYNQSYPPGQWPESPVCSKTISGRVINKFGQPLEKVKVSMCRYTSDDFSGSCLKKAETITDSDGMYDISQTVEEGAYSISFVSTNSSLMPERYEKYITTGGYSYDPVLREYPILFVRTYYSGWNKPYNSPHGLPKMKTVLNNLSRHVYGLLMRNTDSEGTSRIYYEDFRYGDSGMEFIINCTKDGYLQKKGYTQSQDYPKVTLRNVNYSSLSSANSVLVYITDDVKNPAALKIYTVETDGVLRRMGSAYFSTLLPSSAALYIDNIYRGRTPITVSGLGYGTHSYKLTEPGYIDIQNAFQITPPFLILGKVTEMKDIALVPINPLDITGKTSSIYVSTVYPSSANLYVDGIYRGRTPVNVTGLSAGRHAIEMSEPGFNNYISGIDITSLSVYLNRTTEMLDIHLSPVNPPDVTGLTGSVRFSTMLPYSANLYVDGVYRGRTPITVSGLGRGSHSYRLAESGYYASESTVFITDISLIVGRTTEAKDIFLNPINYNTPLKSATGVLLKKSTGARNTYSGSGTFAISGLPDGEYNFTASASGYVSSSVQNIVLEPNTLKEVNISLIPSCVFSGTVMDSSGKALVGTKAELIKDGLVFQTKRISYPSSRYELNKDIPAGAYQVKAYASGYQAQAQDVSCATGEKKAVNFVLAKG